MTAADHANTVLCDDCFNPIGCAKYGCRKTAADHATARRVEDALARAGFEAGSAVRLDFAALVAQAKAAEADKFKLHDWGEEWKVRARAAEADNTRLREQDGQPIQNAARRLLLATDNAERNAALGDLYNALARTENTP